jgi:hypothetical protein
MAGEFIHDLTLFLDLKAALPIFGEIPISENLSTMALSLLNEAIIAEQAPSVDFLGF